MTTTRSRAHPEATRVTCLARRRHINGRTCPTEPRRLSGLRQSIQSARARPHYQPVPRPARFLPGAPPTWANKKPLGEKIINTRVEFLPEKVLLRRKLREKRCIIPADGFYEWKKAGKRTNIPYRFTLKDKSMFGLAGLWEEYEDEQDSTNHTFTVFTALANESLAHVSERMPILLPPDGEKDWLNSSDESTLSGLLHSYSPMLDYYSVSPRVNSPDHNDRLVILPAPPADQFGNLTLFD